MNLLLVNDEVLTAETMRKDMDWKRYGIDEVYTAYSADSARKCINQYVIDIMLCDIEMPKENGISLLRWCRENHKKMECIFLTCHATFTYAQEAISLGCQDYIVIPAKYEDIGNVVHKVATKIHIRQEELLYMEYGRTKVLETANTATEIHGEKQNTAVLVENMVKYICENLNNENFSVNELGEIFHLHPVYLNRIFKKEKGISISQYVINEKMKMAAGLLLTGKLSAAAVADQVGYKNYSNFNITFKKIFHCTPGQYIEKNKLV